jgi:hypothetical protein
MSPHAGLIAAWVVVGLVIGFGIVASFVVFRSLWRLWR